MTTIKLEQRKADKLKFFGIYTLSVVLLFILFSSFFKLGSPDNARRPLVVSASNTDTRAAMDERLHVQAESLENACAFFVQNKASKEAADALQRQEAAFHRLIDSLRNAAASIADKEQKQAIEKLLDDFSRRAKKQIVVVKSSALLTGDSSAVESQAVTELNELKAILLQKEQKIQELENTNQVALQERDKAVQALQAKTSTQTAALPQPGAAGDAVWKENYQKLKASNEKLKETNERYGSQINTLKASYKEVVEDNRRLIGQLQSIRGGKN